MTRVAAIGLRRVPRQGQPSRDARTPAARSTADASHYIEQTGFILPADPSGTGEIIEDGRTWKIGGRSSAANSLAAEATCLSRTSFRLGPNMVLWESTKERVRISRVIDAQGVEWWQLETHAGRAAVYVTAQRVFHQQE